MPRLSATPKVPAPLKKVRALNIRDASARYGPSVSALYLMLRNGQLSDVRVGRSRLLLVEEWERLIEPKQAAGQ